jgi:lysophospholipase L1-like esterase
MQRLPAKLLLACASILLTFVVLEAAFRLLDLRGFHQNRTRGEWMKAMRPKEEGIRWVWPLFRPHAEFTLAYDSNPRGYFDEGNGLTYRMNNQGFRGRDFSTAKPEGVFRIMLVGDSFTFGEGVRLEDTFAVGVERILRAELGTKVDLEVLNVALGAWGTRAEYHYLMKEGLGFEPDLVVLVFVPNDAQYAGGLDIWQDFRAIYEAPALLRRSYLGSWVYSNVARIVLGRRYVEGLVDGAMAKREEWTGTMAMLKDMRRFVNEAGSRYAIVIFPFMYELNDRYPIAPVHELVGEAAREKGIPYLDLLPSFIGRSYTDLWVHPSDQHPNERGHEIAARAMADFLISEELIPQD